MLEAEEMYDVLVTIFNTKSEVNIWRQTSMTINLSSSTILTYDTRHTTVQCGPFWRGGGYIQI
jgi:hypothetical protein